MKILFVMDSLGTGGAERSTSDLWYYLREKNVQLKIIILEHRREGIEKEILGANFDVHFLRPGNFLVQVNALKKLIKEFEPDLVHSVLIRSTFRVRCARFLSKFRSVESLVNCTYDPIRLRDPQVGYFSFYFYKWADYLTASRVDSFIAITQTVKEHYVKLLAIPEEKIEVIYRGRNPNPFLKNRTSVRATLLAELGLADDSILVLSIGRQEFQKGHLVLLKAIRKMEEEKLKRVAFIFLGREGNSTPDIQRFLKTETLKARLYWLGHRLDAAMWLSGSDLFVFPSLYEGLGGVLIEAQAAALPIVCSDLPVLHEVVCNNENALMFECGNSDLLASDLLKLISDREMRSRFSARSLENFERKFGLLEVNHQLLSFYQKLLA